MHQTDSSPQKLWHYGLLIAACFLAYCNVYHNAFLFDDFEMIVQNKFLRSWDSIGTIFTSNVYGGADGHSRLYRPISIFLYLVIFQLFGLSTGAFHFLNVSLHAANACLGYRLGTQLGFRRAAVFVGALVWAVHPIHTEAVTYASETHDLLSLLFCLLGLLLLKQWDHRSVAIAMGCFILGLLSKETAIMFPALLVMQMFLQNLKPWQFHAYAKTAPFWLIALLYFALKIYFLHASGAGLFHPDEVYSQNFLYRFYTFLATLPAYAQLLILPQQLHMERDFPVYLGFFIPQVLAGFVLCAVMALALFYRAKPSVAPIAWGVLWFAIAFVPYSGLLLPINSMFYEHWMYAPTLGLFIGAAVSLEGALQSHEAIKKYVTYIFSFALFMLTVSTIKQNAVWHDPLRFYENILSAGERAPRAHNNLGSAYFDAGAYDKAIEQYKIAIQNSVNYGMPYYNFAVALVRRDTRPETLTEAIGALEQAIKFDPDFKPSYDVLVKIYTLKGDKERAANYQSLLDSK